MNTNLSFKVPESSPNLGWWAQWQGRQAQPGSPFCSSASPHSAARILCCATTASPLACYNPQNRFYTCQGTQAPILRIIRQLLVRLSLLLTITCLHPCSQNTTQHTHHNCFSSIIHEWEGKKKKKRLFRCTSLPLYTHLENENNCFHLAGTAPRRAGLFPQAPPDPAQ